MADRATRATRSAAWPTTAGAAVVAELTQKRQDIQLATYIGSGKVEELTELVAVDRRRRGHLRQRPLARRRSRNLEKAARRQGARPQRTDPRHLRHAGPRRVESRLQVELAQLEYSLPRLKQMWTHLSRQKGGGIGLRGPGETQLESDRRLVGGRIRDLKHKLAEVQARKEREVKSRAAEHTVSLVGYTNAGKSHLMNTLTEGGRAT